MERSKYVENTRGRRKIGDIFIDAVGYDGFKQLGKEHIDEVLMSLTCYPFGQWEDWVSGVKECYNFEIKEWELEKAHERVEREMDEAMANRPQEDKK